MFVNTSASFLASLVPAPGGIGVAEAALIGALTAFGIPSEMAVATVVTHRLFTTYLPPIWGSYATKWLVARGLPLDGCAPRSASSAASPAVGCRPSKFPRGRSTHECSQVISAPDRSSWSMLWFFLFFIWIWLLITVFADIFRSHDMGGFAKFLWVIFVIFLPVPRRVRLPDRTRSQDERARDGGRRRPQQDYIRQVAGTSGGQLRRRARTPRRPQGQGVIDDAEFNKLKAKIVG